MTLPVGATLGPYQIIGPLGAGGMGEVYRARDTKLGRDVALKLLPDAFASHTERLVRFEREARVLASLNHPNIATIYGLEEANGQRALVMELVDGSTLADRIGARALPLDDALAIARQISEALEYAHDRGVVHRDLKPANIQMTPGGTIKLLDFGLAKILQGSAVDESSSQSHTVTVLGTEAGVVIGTVAYMSPEQARGEAVDKRTDIWALGVVLYELVTGKRPFSGSTASDTLAAVLKSEPDWSAVPEVLRRFLRRCLQKDARQRWRDAGDVRIALTEMRDAGPAPSPPASQGLPSALAWLLLLTLGVGLWWRPPWRAMFRIDNPVMRLSVDLGPNSALDVPFFGPVLSPDGKRVVFVGRGQDGKSGLYVRSFEQGDAVFLPGTELASCPFFSPDGQSVAFFAGGKLKKVAIDGGGATELCDAPAGRGGSRGDNGIIVAALNVRGGLSRIAATGGPVQPVTQLDPIKNEFTHRVPLVLPGSDVLLFTSNNSSVGFDDATIEAQSLRTGRRTTLVRGYFPRYVAGGYLLYAQQGTIYAAPFDADHLQLGAAVPIVEDAVTVSTTGFAFYDVSTEGTLVYVRSQTARHTLTSLDDTGRNVPLHVPLADYYGPLRFSPDGERLAMSTMDRNGSDIWLFGFKQETMTRLTFTPGVDAFPVWTPDGKHIVFASQRHRGALNLYWTSADGTGDAVRLTESTNDQRPWSFAPDGHRLAFHEISSETNYDLWTVPIELDGAGHPKAGTPQPFLVTPFIESSPTISPDGRWLAYSSTESGSAELYVKRFPDGTGKWQITVDGGAAPAWSKTRPELFYAASAGLMVVRYSANGEAFVAGKPEPVSGSRVAYDSTTVAGSRLLDYDVAPDGRHFAVVRNAAGRNESTHVVLVLNFLDVLRHKVSR